MLWFLDIQTKSILVRIALSRRKENITYSTDVSVISISDWQERYDIFNLESTDDIINPNFPRYILRYFNLAIMVLCASYIR